MIPVHCFNSGSALQHGSITMRSIVAVAAGAAVASAARIGDGWGTNIHWTSALPGEAEMMSSAFKVARMDFNVSVLALIITG